MNYFERLPEGCIFEIISLTTPADAVRSAILSRGFKFAAESDEIWGRFLPSDYQEIIDRSEFPPVCITKKELFFSLFSEVAHLGFVCWLDIRGRIGTEMLSPKTDYAAYLVFKLEPRKTFGLLSANAIIRFVNYESDTETEQQANTVELETYPQKRGNIFVGNNNQKIIVSGNIPKIRGDGWLEVELGYFNSKKGDDGPVEARLLEIKRLHCKCGLIVEGIEFRPKIIEYKSSDADMGDDLELYTSSEL
ncbi:hypothetical protein K7X08_013971 [Anisodus acutangulus]|uniref:Uncharacterized protein n=1 Tax=Anisodus acutangulus TaxID=402998 RepID=A0A9Q1LPS6_9SOLA|nr:hypothetical protein K7X08_013971 [Anisodus acutangulus]